MEREISSVLSQPWNLLGFCFYSMDFESREELNSYFSSHPNSSLLLQESDWLLYFYIFFHDWSNPSMLGRQSHRCWCTWACACCTHAFTHVCVWIHEYIETFSYIISFLTARESEQSIWNIGIAFLVAAWVVPHAKMWHHMNPPGQQDSW